MKKYSLQKMTRGWFIGDFSPACLKTKAAEAGVKLYKKGDYEEAHFHKVATEVTAIISGKAKVNGRRYGAGDILVIEPGECADFLALEDVRTVVIKIPGAPNDKFIKEGPGNAEHCNPHGGKRKPLPRRRL
ncbi:MAG: hypothetical protein COT18_09960 [Elusimicrobia bacterium CG08_land_8_20_14_0_20_59_10]|nr:MAG: hypothetical protein COT18_09960 [Elusimicrobia bacterium CG08_land_8_20_14_0_20_59_10]